MGENSIKYWINKNGSNQGPFSINELIKRYEMGEFSSGDRICPNGEEEWLNLGKVIESGIEEQNYSDEFDDPKKVILAKKSGFSLNAFLTVTLFFLLLVCTGLYIFLQFRSGVGLEEEEFSDRSKIDLDSVKSFAVDANLLKLEDGIILFKKENTPFTGWSKLEYLKGGSISTLIQYEVGKVNVGHSWQPNGEKCPETSLVDGKGILVEYFESGNKRMMVSYRGGIWEGVKTTWHENEQRSIEENFLNGKLHGQRIVWHKNGQKIEQVFYLEGQKSGPYSYWDMNGQKYEEGIYKYGKYDGKRIQWSRDGSERTEEVFEDGKLVQEEPVEISVEEMEDEVDQDILLSQLLNLSNEQPIWNEKAQVTFEQVKFIQQRFEKSKMSGHEVFAELALGLFSFSKDGGDINNGIIDSLKSIQSKWGISIFPNDKEFFLSDFPDSVQFGSIIRVRAEYEQEYIGLLRGESRDFVIGDLEKLFDGVGLELKKETQSIQKKVEKQIWDEFALKAEDSKNAELEYIDGNLVHKGTIEKRLKKINPQGNSIFETVEEDVVYIFNQRNAVDKPIGAFSSVLGAARSKYEEIINGTLMIRKYSNLCVFSDKLSPDGATCLYPDITVQFAGVAPLDDDTMIRFIKVELGEILEDPYFVLEE